MYGTFLRTCEKDPSFFVQHLSIFYEGGKTHIEHPKPLSFLQSYINQYSPLNSCSTTIANRLTSIEIVQSLLS